MLSFHYHRHCAHVSLTAMFGMNVFQHCLSGQRSRISKASVKVSDSLCVCAGTTDESRASVISTDAVHNGRVQNLFRVQCDQDHFVVNGA
jgi:hypothetical protein